MFRHQWSVSNVPSAKFRQQMFCQHCSASKVDKTRVIYDGVSTSLETCRPPFRCVSPVYQVRSAATERIFAVSPVYHGRSAANECTFAVLLCITADLPQLNVTLHSRYLSVRIFVSPTNTAYRCVDNCSLISVIICKSVLKERSTELSVFPFFSSEN